jgi:hypothetical protein
MTQQKKFQLSFLFFVVAYFEYISATYLHMLSINCEFGVTWMISSTQHAVYFMCNEMEKIGQQLMMLSESRLFFEENIGENSK